MYSLQWLLRSHSEGQGRPVFIMLHVFSALYSSLFKVFFNTCFIVLTIRYFSRF